MDAIPYSRLRSNLASEMDRVCADHAPIIVTRKASASVVMISPESTTRWHGVSPRPDSASSKPARPR